MYSHRLIVGAMEMMDKFTRRTVKATKQHTEECKKLLRLMGIPVIQAPCEAEAQCASLVRGGFAFAAGSEDMDTLTFATPVLLRHLTFSEARKMPISEIILESMLEGLEMNMDEFIDLCILLGCDYCDSIKGIGPTRAVTLIKQYRNIETILQNLDPEKYPIPTEWPFKEARDLFKHPNVLTADDPQLAQIKWEQPNEEEIVKFMVTENGFNEKRIRAGVEKLIKARGTSQQGRLDSFFKVIPTEGKRKEVEVGVKRSSLTSKGSKKSKLVKAAK